MCVTSILLYVDCRSNCELWLFENSKENKDPKVGHIVNVKPTQNVIVSLAMTERCQRRFTEKFDHQNNIVYVGTIIGSLAVLYFYRWCKYEAYKSSFSLCDMCANPVLVCADFTSRRSRLAMFWDVWLVTTG